MDENQVNAANTGVANGGNPSQEGATQTNPSANSDENQKVSLTQKELDAKFQERAERAAKSEREKIFAKYGIQSEKELDDLVTEGKKSPEYKKSLESYAADKEKLALTLNGIDPSMEEEVKFYFKGKGIELTSENLQKEMENGKHAHWSKQTPAAPQTTPQQSGVVITNLGSKAQEADAYEEQKRKFYAYAGMTPRKK